MKYFIKADEWKVIFGLLKTVKRIHMKNEAKVRRFFEAIWYVGRTGCKWRLLPAYYGNWRSIHRRFKKWTQKGIWTHLFQGVHDRPDMEAVMIDATVVRAHACSRLAEKQANLNKL